MSSPLNVHLEAYEGPLDLLLDLIRKQQINIYDIPIAKITSQYLEYMQRAAGLSIELSADGPMRPPFNVFVQGGLSRTHVEIAMEVVLERLVAAGYLREPTQTY